MINYRVWVFGDKYSERHQLPVEEFCAKYCSNEDSLKELLTYGSLNFKHIIIYVNINNYKYRNLLTRELEKIQKQNDK